MMYSLEGVIKQNNNYFIINQQFNSIFDLAEYMHTSGVRQVRITYQGRPWQASWEPFHYSTEYILPHPNMSVNSTMPLDLKAYYEDGIDNFNKRRTEAYYTAFTIPHSLRTNTQRILFRERKNYV